jgi:hypothetical protein
MSSSKGMQRLIVVARRTEYGGFPAFVLLIGLLVLIAWLVFTFSFDWPQADDFNLLIWYRLWQTAEWNFWDLLSVKNGSHLQGFQALLGVILFRLFGVHFIDLNFLNVLFVGFSATLVYLLVASSFELLGQKLLALSLIVLLFFHPAQTNHILWSYEFGWFFISLVLVTNLWLSERYRERALPWIVLSATLGFLSSAQGTFLWLAAAFHFALIPDLRYRKVIICGVLVVSFAIAAFTILQISDHKYLSLSGHDATGFGIYLLQLIGSEFGIRKPSVCLAFGIASVVFTGVIVWRTYWSQSIDRTDRVALTLIFASIVFVIGFAVGRYQFGIEWALDRLHAAPLVVPWFVGTTILCLKQAAICTDQRQACGHAYFVLVAVLAASLVTSFGYASARAKESFTARAFAMRKTCESFESFVPRYLIHGVNDVAMDSPVEDNLLQIKHLCTDDVPLRVLRLETLPGFFVEIAQQAPYAKDALQDLWNIYTFHYDLQRAFPLTHRDTPKRLLQFAINNADSGSKYESAVLATHAVTFRELRRYTERSE